MNGAVGVAGCAPKAGALPGCATPRHLRHLDSTALLAFPSIALKPEGYSIPKTVAHLSCRTRLTSNPKPPKNGKPFSHLHISFTIELARSCNDQTFGKASTPDSRIGFTNSTAMDTNSSAEVRSAVLTHCFAAP